MGKGPPPAHVRDRPAPACPHVARAISFAGKVSRVPLVAHVPKKVLGIFKQETFRAISSRTLLGVARQVCLQLGFCAGFFSFQFALGRYFPLPSPPAPARLGVDEGVLTFGKWGLPRAVRYLAASFPGLSAGAVWGLREVPERLRVKLGSGNLVGFVFLHRLGLQWSLCSAGRANIGAL